MSLVVRVSSSMLSTVETCRVKAWLHTQGFGSPAAPAYMVAGRAVHQALEGYLEGKSRQDILTTLVDFYGPYSNTYVPTDDRLDITNVQRSMEAFLANQPASSLPFEPIKAEYQVENEFTSLDGVPVLLTDRWDGVVASREPGLEDTLWVVEWKTTGVVRLSDFANYKVAPQNYTHIWSGLQEGYDIRGVRMCIIPLKRLPEPSKDKCREHKIPKEYCWQTHAEPHWFRVQHDRDQVEWWAAQAAPSAQLYADVVLDHVGADPIKVARELPMDGLGSRTACAGCDFREFCHEGRRQNPNYLQAQAESETGILRSGLYRIENGQEIKL